MRRNVSVLGIDEIFSKTAPPFKAIILYITMYVKNFCCIVLKKKAAENRQPYCGAGDRT